MQSRYVYLYMMHIHSICITVDCYRLIHLHDFILYYLYFIIYLCIYICICFDVYVRAKKANAHAYIYVDTYIHMYIMQ